MYWLFKTTVRFQSDDGIVSRLDYLVSAGNTIEAKCELESRFLSQEIFGYKIESVIEATEEETVDFKLPAGCVMLLR